MLAGIQSYVINFCENKQSLNLFGMVFRLLSLKTNS